MQFVTRRLFVWVFTFPLMVAGSQLAHLVAYQIVFPDPNARAAALERTGHGYATWMPLVIAVGLAVSACSLAAWTAHVRARPAARAHISLAFAAVPPTIFLFQEYFERLLHTGIFPYGAALEPSFFVGLALQLPFALLVYLLARELLRVAERLVRPRPRRARRSGGVPPVDPVALAPRLRRIRPLADGRAVRGPPVHA